MGITINYNFDNKEKGDYVLQFIIEIICKLIILFPLKGMGVPIVEFVWEYKFSAG